LHSRAVTIIPSAPCCRLAWALVLGAIIPAALPAQASSAKTPAESVVMEKILVTGSHLPGAASGAVTPVIVLTARDLAATGLDANLLESLRKRIPGFSGNANLGPSNATSGVSATMGGAQLALHNLDTLVLLNGRRVAPNGANGRGGSSFVDVNQIPAAAIARVEIVGDGASAIYGSDAVGGVVNVILKSDYRGLELGGRFATAAGGGGYTERSGHLVAGTGTSGFNLTASATWSKTAPLFQKDRPFSASITGQNATLSGALGDGPAFPRYFLNPSLNSPRDRNPTGSAASATSLAQLVANGTYLDLGAAAFTTIAGTFDVAPYQTLLLGQEKKSGVVTATAELAGKKLVAFADFLRTETHSFSQLTAQSAVPNLTVPAGAPFNPLAATISQVAFRYNPAPRQFAHDSQLTRATLGLRGALAAGWDWETACTWNDNAVTQRVKNALYGPNLDRAIAGGFNAHGAATPGGAFSRVVTGSSEAGAFVLQPALDPFARSDGLASASLDNLFGTYVAAMRSRLRSVDFKLSGQPLALPAGKIAVALGGDIRREQLAGTPDENARLSGPTGRRWLGAPYFDPFVSTREIKAGFAEVRVPLAGETSHVSGVRALDVSAAWRVENYSDFGRSRAPKFGVRWQPVDRQLTLRGTSAEAFTAPPLFSLFGPVSQVFTAVAVIPSVFGSNGQARSRTGANPTLRSSTARTRSLGVSFAPAALPGFTASLDYLRVAQNNLAGTVGAATILQSVEQLGAASPYAAQVALGNYPGEAGTRAIKSAGELGSFLRAGNSASGIFLTDTRTNIAGLRLHALDLALAYALPASPDLGRLRLNTTATVFLASEFQALPTQPYYDYAGFATNGGTGAQGTLPRYRTYSSAAWARGAWQANLGQTFIPSVTDIGPGGLTFATNPALRRRPVASFAAWDFSLGYTFDRDPNRTARRPRKSFRDLQLTVGVNNLTNRLPPLAPQAFSDSNVDLSTYSVVGRLWFVSCDVHF